MRSSSREPSITIREGTFLDADALSELARRSKASWGYPESWLDAWEDQLRFTRSTFERCAVFVAERDGRCAGVAVLSVDSRRAEAELEHLWVDPPAQGRGVGRVLVRECVTRSRAQGARSIRIVSDPQAREFYEGLGARYEGEIDAPVLGESRTLPVLRIDLASGAARQRP